MVSSKRFLFGALTLGAMVACGSTASTGTSSTDGGTGSVTSDVTAYQTLANEAFSAVTSYRAGMMDSGVTLATCKTIHDGYDGKMRPWIAQMKQMAGGMDDFMVGHGHGTNADVTCVAGTMMDELDYHRSTACTSATVAANQAEAARHADAMNGYAAHSRDRCGEMLGGAATWMPAMHGCEQWGSLCCSSMMHGTCCGQMMSGQGTMHTNDCCDHAR